jgi:ectoine hydroxylase-related dioxygenase (phytanoyl-CoA dioxygenase family)
MWLALDDADESNGCVWYIPGSHLQGLRPHQFSGILGFSQKCSDFGTRPEDAHCVAMQAVPGDLLAHHSLTMHGAGANTTADRQRRALGFIFYRSDVRIDSVRHANYQRELAAAWAAEGKI